MFARTRSPRPTSPARPVAIEQLEKRELLATSPVFAGSKIKVVNLSSNGVSTNQSLITIPFTGNIQILDSSKIQLRGYAIRPDSASGTAQVKKVINVVSAQLLPSDHSFLQVTT